MKGTKHRHTGRYAKVYERGYQTSLESHYHIYDSDVSRRFRKRPVSGPIKVVKPDGSVHRYLSHCDDYTGRMSAKAAAAFEDGWFDAREDESFQFQLPRT